MHLALVASTFNKAIILLDYHVNRAYIANALCVNKSNPGSCCKGKCYVKKKLQHQENDDKSNGGKEKFETDWIFEEPVQQEAIALQQYEFFESAGMQLPNHLSPGVFHPPLVFPG